MDPIKILSADDILQAADLKPVQVDMSKWWPGAVFVRGATAEERDEYENSLYTSKVNDNTGKVETSQNTKNARARLVVRCLVNDQNTQLFKGTAAEIQALGRKGAAPINHLFQKISELSGMDKKSIKEAEKNSGTTPTQDSGTSSQDTSEPQ